MGDRLDRATLFPLSTIETPVAPETAYSDLSTHEIRVQIGRIIQSTAAPVNTNFSGAAPPVDGSMLRACSRAGNCGRTVAGVPAVMVDRSSCHSGYKVLE